MPKSLVIQVPAEIADELLLAGYDEPYEGRDPANAADVVLTTISLWTALGADGIAVLVGTGQLADLYRRIRSWIGAHGRDRVELNATLNKDGRKMRVSVSIDDAGHESDSDAIEEFARTITKWISD